MEMKTVCKFIAAQDEKLRQHFKLKDQTKLALSYCVKLSEEVGELSSEVLKKSSLKRKTQKNNNWKNFMADEVADVLITTMLLAQVMHVNIESALEAKIKKIIKRGGI